MSFTKIFLTGCHKSWEYFYLCTFIGVVVHELAHKWFAESAGLEIDEAVLFTTEDEKGRLGYVNLKNGPRTYKDLLAINVAPFLVNTIIAFSTFTGIFIFIYVYGFMEIHWGMPLLFTAAAWFGVSVSLHAFLSRTDINNIYTGKKLVWNATEPRVLTWLSDHLDDNPIMFMLLGPIHIPLRILHVLIYSITHPRIILGFPFVITVDILSRTKKYGSNFIFTAGLIYISYYATVTYMPHIPEL